MEGDVSLQYTDDASYKCTLETYITTINLIKREKSPHFLCGYKKFCFVQKNLTCPRCCTAES